MGGRRGDVRYKQALIYEGKAKESLKEGHPGKASKYFNDAARLYGTIASSIRGYIEKNKDDPSAIISQKYYIGLRNATEKAESARRSADRLQKVRRGKWHGLEGLSAAAAIIGIIGGIFFLFDPGITGNAIGNLSNSSQNGVGIILFALGLIGAFIYTSRRRK